MVRSGLGFSILSGIGVACGAGAASRGDLIKQHQQGLLNKNGVSRVELFTCIRWVMVELVCPTCSVHKVATQFAIRSGWLRICSAFCTAPCKALLAML